MEPTQNAPEGRTYTVGDRVRYISNSLPALGELATVTSTDRYYLAHSNVKIEFDREVHTRRDWIVSTASIEPADLPKNHKTVEVNVVVSARTPHSYDSHDLTAYVMWQLDLISTNDLERGRVDISAVEVLDLKELALPAPKAPQVEPASTSLIPDAAITAYREAWEAKSREQTREAEKNDTDPVRPPGERIRAGLAAALPHLVAPAKTFEAVPFKRGDIVKDEFGAHYAIDGVDITGAVASTKVHLHDVATKQTYTVLLADADLELVPGLRERT